MSGTSSGSGFGFGQSSQPTNTSASSFGSGGNTFASTSTTGAPTTTSAPSLFGSSNASSATTGPPIVTSAPSLFGSSNASTGAATLTSAPPGFGLSTVSTGALGMPAVTSIPSLFGQPHTSTTATGTPFLSNTPSTFGQSNTLAATQPATTTPSVFGSFAAPTNSLPRAPVSNLFAQTGGSTTTPIITFNPLYGDPNWRSRPEVPYNQADNISPPMTDASYEENRLRALNQQNAAKVMMSHLSISNSQSSGRLSPAASSLSRQKIYLKWCQSPHIEFLAGPDEISFKLPGDFMTRRSRPFNIMIGSKFIEADTRVIRLPETDAETFEQVLIWSMSPQPALHNELPISTAVDIAIFANMYLMPSLLNQALDLLWLCVNEAHVWTPDLFERIYRYTDAESPLRRFARAMLPVVDHPVGIAQLGAKIARWQSVFEENAELGFDYFAMKQGRWTITNVITGGPCWFHQHTRGISTITDKPYDLPLCKARQSMECFEDVDDVEPRNAIQGLVDHFKTSGHELVKVESQEH